MIYFFHNLRNIFDFYIRSHVTFSRKNYKEKAFNLSEVFEDEEGQNLYENINHKYDISILANLSCRNFLENLYYLNVFDKYFTKRNKDNVSILDIGSKNWNYAGSEYIFFRSFLKEFSLNGIELDAYRMSSNFYTRYEIAKFYIRDMLNTNYIVGDFREHEQKYDYIIWILPFITKYPLVKWGLPLKYYQPENMLLHAYNLLNPNGEMLIINQGEKEFSAQQELNDKLKISAQYIGCIDDKFSLYKNHRYCSKINKPD